MDAYAHAQLFLTKTFTFDIEKIVIFAFFFSYFQFFFQRYMTVTASKTYFRLNEEIMVAQMVQNSAFFNSYLTSLYISCLIFFIYSIALFIFGQLRERT